MSVAIVKMEARHAMEIQRQASQRVQLGLERDITLDEAEALASDDEAWTAIETLPDGSIRIAACMGLRETFAGRQAVAWTIFAELPGRAHIAITRHARARIAASPLKRIEAIVLASRPAEITWAKRVGLTPAHVLRNFGAASEDHVLFERIR